MGMAGSLSGTRILDSLRCHGRGAPPMQRERSPGTLAASRRAQVLGVPCFRCAFCAAQCPREHLAHACQVGLGWWRWVDLSNPPLTLHRQLCHVSDTSGIAQPHFHRSPLTARHKPRRRVDVGLALILLSFSSSKPPSTTNPPSRVLAPNPHTSTPAHQHTRQLPPTPHFANLLTPSYLASCYRRPTASTPSDLCYVLRCFAQRKVHCFTCW